MFIVFASTKENVPPQKQKHTIRNRVSLLAVIRTRVTNNDYWPIVARVWVDTPDRDISFHIIYRISIFLVFVEFKRKFITCFTDKLACSQRVRIRQDARFPIFQKPIYCHIICVVSTTMPRKASFRRMTSEGEARRVIKNIGVIL